LTDLDQFGLLEVKLAMEEAPRINVGSLDSLGLKSLFTIC